MEGLSVENQPSTARGTACGADVALPVPDCCETAVRAQDDDIVA
jgi:hypothetical protein